MATSDRVVSILMRDGPQISTFVAKKLMSLYGMSSEAARQAISRSTQKVRKLKGIVFPHRARFLYLDSQYGMRMFSNNLLAALKESNHHCYLGLSILRERGGVLPLEHFIIACGAPKKQLRQVSAERVLENMLASNLARQLHVNGVGECLALGTLRDEEIDIASLKARLVTEALALNAVREWTRRLGIGGYNQVLVRGENPEPPSAGPNYWDLTAPSYLFPLLGASTDPAKKKPGSFVCDIYLDGKLTEPGIEPFIKKCLNVRGFAKVSPVLQMFVADSYDSQAIKRIKGSGAIAATIDTLLGTEVAQALKNLAETLTSTAESARDPEKLDKLFETLLRIEGAAVTLRGCLFEYVAAEIARELYNPAEIILNRIVTSAITGAQAEIDVLVKINRKALVFIECKGHKPKGTVDEAEVEKWLNKRLPTLRDYVKAHSEYKACEQSYELWTNASLTENSKKLIAERQALTDKYTLSYREGLDLLAIAEESGNKPLIRTYKQHFRNHPLNI